MGNRAVVGSATKTGKPLPPFRRNSASPQPGEAASATEAWKLQNNCRLPFSMADCHLRWRMMADPPSGWQKVRSIRHEGHQLGCIPYLPVRLETDEIREFETRSRIVGVATTVIGGLCASPAARCCFAHAVQQRFPSHFPIGASHCRFGGRDSPRAGGRTPHGRSAVAERQLVGELRTSGSEW